MISKLFSISPRPLQSLCEKIRMMDPNETTARKVEAAFRIHAGLAPGWLETVSEVTLARELRKCGLRVRRQVPVHIEGDGLPEPPSPSGEVEGGGSRRAAENAEKTRTVERGGILVNRISNIFGLD
jgi:hypothetical protein